MSNSLTLRTLPQVFSTPAVRAPAPTMIEDLNRTLLRAVETLELWGARFEQRRTLRTLSDELLHDIGRSRLDAEAEAAKPFWRA